MILDQDFHLFNVGEHSSYLCGKYAGELLSLVLQDDIQQTARFSSRAWTILTFGQTDSVNWIWLKTIREKFGQLAFGQ